MNTAPAEINEKDQKLFRGFSFNTKLDGSTLPADQEKTPNNALSTKTNTPNSAPNGIAGTSDGEKYDGGGGGGGGGGARMSVMGATGTGAGGAYRVGLIDPNDSNALAGGEDDGSGEAGGGAEPPGMIRGASDGSGAGGGAATAAARYGRAGSEVAEDGAADPNAAAADPNAPLDGAEAGAAGGEAGAGANARASDVGAGQGLPLDASYQNSPGLEGHSLNSNPRGSGAAPSRPSGLAPIDPSSNQNSARYRSPQSDGSGGGSSGGSAFTPKLGVPLPLSAVSNFSATGFGSPAVSQSESGGQRHAHPHPHHRTPSASHLTLNTPPILSGLPVSLSGPLPPLNSPPAIGSTPNTNRHSTVDPSVDRRYLHSGHNSTGAGSARDSGDAAGFATPPESASAFELEQSSRTAAAAAAVAASAASVDSSPAAPATSGSPPAPVRTVHSTHLSHYNHNRGPVKSTPD